MTTCKLCLCLCKRSFLNIMIDCEKIGENRGSKDTSYSPFSGTVGRDHGNMWIVSIRLVNQNCIPCCILLLLRSRVPFHARFQRFQGDFEGVFLFYFRLGFWRKRRNWSDSLIIEDLDVAYTREIGLAVSSWFAFLGLRADEVVFYPPPDVHFQATG